MQDETAPQPPCQHALVFIQLLSKEVMNVLEFQVFQSVPVVFPPVTGHLWKSLALSSLHPLHFLVIFMFCLHPMRSHSIVQCIAMMKV